MTRFHYLAAMALVAGLGASAAPAVAAQALRLEEAPRRATQIAWKRGYHPKAVRVVDGDTISVTKATGTVSVRAYGFDAPELHIPCERVRAVAAKDELARIIASGRLIVRESSNIHDKFGRAIGDLLVDNHRVADLMVGRGFAHAYTGGKRPGWEGC